MINVGRWTHGLCVRRRVDEVEADSHASCVTVRRQSQSHCAEIEDLSHIYIALSVLCGSDARYRPDNLVLERHVPPAGGSLLIIILFPAVRN
jgi:hypothetical protein